MKKKISMIVAMGISAFMQAVAMNMFLRPVHLLPGGFTGLATIVEYATQTFGFMIPTAVGTILLNIPLAIYCYNHLGKKFVKLSMLQIALFSIFLRLIPEQMIFEDNLLNVCFGGVLYGFALAVALRFNGSSGGMDFISLYVSNKLGRSILNYIFMFNAVMISVFGYFFGWEYAGYSIMFQYISTQTTDHFYLRFKRVTLLITTLEPEKMIEEYIKNCHHGISRIDGRGGYSGKEIALLFSVVSAYEVSDLLEIMEKVDPGVIVNIMPTENFHGSFYQQPLE